MSDVLTAIGWILISAWESKKSSTYNLNPRVSGTFILFNMTF
jgi:hypothetical protein